MACRDYVSYQVLSVVVYQGTSNGGHRGPFGSYRAEGLGGFRATVAYKAF